MLYLWYFEFLERRMQIDLSKLFNWEYLNRIPSADFLFFWPLLIIFVASIILGIALSIFKKFRSLPAHTERLLKWLIIWFFFPPFVGMILVLARNQAIWSISHRLFLLIFLLIWLLGFLALAIYRFSRYKKLAYHYWLWQEKQKYLPKSNK